MLKHKCKEVILKKVVIVTGGSRGIGAATSKLLASKGYAVCVNFRSEEHTSELQSR